MWPSPIRHDRLYHAIQPNRARSGVQVGKMAGKGKAVGGKRAAVAAKTAAVMTRRGMSKKKASMFAKKAAGKC